MAWGQDDQVLDYDTQLSPDEEKQFQSWKSKFAPKDSGEDYDLRGAFKAKISPDPGTGHWPDTFKKPNHPTFSNQSIYANSAPDKAGSWNSENYVPPSSGAWGKDDEVLGASPEEPSYDQKLAGWRQGAQISQGEKAKIDQAQSILDDTTHYPEGSPEYVKAKSTVFRTGLPPAPEPETTAQGYKEGGLMGAFRAPLLPQRYVETGLNDLGEIGATVPSDLQSDPISQNINRAIAERVSGFSSPESLAQLPSYAIPGVAEAQGINMLSELPDKAEAIKKALKSGDNATAAGDIAGTLLDTAMGAGMAGGRYFKMRADTKAEAIKQALGFKTPVESSQPISATTPQEAEQTQSSPKQMAGNEASVRPDNPEGLYEPDRGSPFAQKESDAQTVMDVLAKGGKISEQDADALAEIERRNKETGDTTGPGLSPELQKTADDLGLTYSGVHLGKLHLFQDTGEGQKPTSVSVPLNATPEQLRAKVEVARNQMAFNPSVPEQSIPKGTSNRAFEETYGKGEVPTGEGIDVGQAYADAKTAIATGKADPYEVLSRTKKYGIARPEEYAILTAESERLRNEASRLQRMSQKDPSLSPMAEEAVQRAKEFDTAIQPHKTAASDLMRLFQDRAEPDLTSEFGMSELMKNEIGREPTNMERPVMQKMAKDIGDLQDASTEKVQQSDARVQKRFKNVKDISFDDAASRVKDLIEKATKDCVV